MTIASTPERVVVGAINTGQACSALRRPAPGAPPVVNMVASRPSFDVGGCALAGDAVAYAGGP